MCGGGPRATITQPDYTAFNQQFELQKSAIDQSMNGGIMEMQAEFQRFTAGADGFSAND